MTLLGKMKGNNIFLHFSPIMHAIWGGGGVLDFGSLREIEGSYQSSYSPSLKSSSHPYPYPDFLQLLRFASLICKLLARSDHDEKQFHGLLTLLSVMTWFFWAAAKVTYIHISASDLLVFRLRENSKSPNRPTFISQVDLGLSSSSKFPSPWL